MSNAIKLVVGEVLVVAGVFAIAAGQPWGFALVDAGEALQISAIASQIQLWLGPGSPRAAPLTGTAVNYGGTLEPRRILYGQLKIGGINVLPPMTSGSSNDYLHQVLAFAGEQISGFGDAFLNQVRIPHANIGAITGSANDGKVGGTSGYQNDVWIRLYDGSQTSVDFILDSTFVEWDSNHIGYGIPYAALQFKWDQNVFSSGFPQFSVIAKGKKIYDPRLDSTNGGSGSQRYTTPSTWTYSTNPALCLRDYLTSKLGLGEDQTRIDDTLVSAAANICDQTVSVPIPVVTGLTNWTHSSATVTGLNTEFLQVLGSGYYLKAPNGSMVQISGLPTSDTQLTLASLYAGATASAQVIQYNNVNSATKTQPRYTCNTVMAATATFEQNIAQLAGAMMGHCLYSGGKWRMYAGAWSGSAFALGADDVVGSVTVQAATARTNLFNTVRGNFIDPQSNYQAVEFPPVIDSGYVASDGETIAVETNFPCCVDIFEAQRNAIIINRQGRNQRIVTAQFGLSAYGVRLFETGTLTLAELGWLNQTVRCIGWKFSPSGMVELTLQEAYSTDFADPNAATDYVIKGINVMRKAGRSSLIYEVNKNYLNTSNWTLPGTGGSFGNWEELDGNTAGGNTLLQAGDPANGSPLGPFGHTEAIWRAIGGTGGSGAEGIENSGDLAAPPIDTSRTYRYSVWFQYTGTPGTGLVYFGPGDGPGPTFNLSPGTPDAHPYFAYSPLSGLTAGQWYLLVGILHGYGYTGGDTGQSGIWSPITGDRVAAGNGLSNGVNVGDGADFKCAQSIDKQKFRTFLNNCNNATTKGYFARPRVELIDGAEKSVRSLLGVIDPSNSPDTVPIARHGVLPKGNIMPMVQDAPFTYTSTTSSVTISWTAYKVYRPDGSFFTVTAGSQTITGLSAGMTYVTYAYSTEAAPSAIGLATSGAATGSPACCFPPSATYAQLSATFASVSQLGYIFQGKITTATTSSGTGGGGGGGGGFGCPHPTQHVMTSNGPIRADALKIGDELLTPAGWSPILKITLRPQHEFMTIAFNSDATLLVSMDHRFVAPDGEQIRARDLKIGTILASGEHHVCVNFLRLRTDDIDAIAIELADPHYYYLTPGGPLSHNNKP